MWEEQPEYQKSQAKLIGVVLGLLFIYGVVYCISERDWDLLGQVLLFAGALVVAIGLLSGTAWLLVKIFTRGRRRDSDEDL
ncbi:MAG: hypothetical protein V9H26_18935 [Verrucomicrobiota bacterium]|nr:hypothetical protein [Verrucomicrobiota bacterium]MCC6820999.1 hypothetical protein [Limisphaerales bacterium]